MSKLPDKYMSIMEVAKLFGVCRRSIERRIAEGKLSKMKVGSRTVIAVEEVERFMKRNTERAQ
ncbi:MAG: helix-turn-helix domain-containing protein [Phycisphaerales bacterium]|nr:helix-turn-helix domain-containing protein [Phycisphaerales bacterium]